MTTLSAHRRLWVPPGTGRLPARWRDAGIGVLFALLTAGLYLHYSLKAGWYYDDWRMYARLRDAGGSWSHQVSACSATINAGRSLACVYHATEYDLFGAHRVAYHLTVMVFLVAIALMSYAILKRCRLGWPWAALATALMLLSPVSDSARLWSVAAVGQAVIALQLLGVLLALAALGRPPGRSRTALHVAAAVASVLAMATYEIAVPLVALNILIYFAAFRNRRAVLRGLVDIALVILFVVYRVALSPVDASSGYAVKRSLGADISRGWLLLRTAWSTWHAAYLPGTAGVVALVVVVAAAGLVVLLVPAARARIGFWAAILAGSVVVSALGAMIYLTSNDLYLPALYGTFNRLNLAATLAYAVGFTALLALGWEVLAATGPLKLLAPVVVGVALVAVGLHQRTISNQHKTAWEVSWQDQEVALAWYRVTLKTLPRHSRILGFDTPEWEAGFVPVFASTWDLRGAIDYTTPVDPPLALEFSIGSACGREGVTLGGTLIARYASTSPGRPLYAVSPSREQAIRVTSQQSCEHVVKLWGRAPFWGSTVTG